VIRTVSLVIVVGLNTGCAVAPPADENSGALARMAACTAPTERSDRVSISDPASFTAVWAFSMVHCRDGVTHPESERMFIEQDRVLRERAAKARREQAAAVERAAAAVNAPPRG